MSELFSGVWAIDVEASKVWDDATGSYVADAVGDEVITLTVADGVQDYEVLYGDRPAIRMGYTSRYDDPTWVEYLVRGIDYGTADPVQQQAEVEAFKTKIKAVDGERERRFEIGRAYGLVRTVYVDDRTHYRVSKSPEDGSAQSIMLRRMAEDGNSYLASVLTVDGVIYRVRRFVRVTSV